MLVTMAVRVLVLVLVLVLAPMELPPSTVVTVVAVELVTV
jgi:hypothetical protein